MKKILFLAIALVMSVSGAWAEFKLGDAKTVNQLSANMKIALKCVSNTNENWLCFDATKVTNKAQFDASCVFTLEAGATENSYRLKNASNNKYIGSNTGSFAEQADAVNFTLTGVTSSDGSNMVPLTEVTRFVNGSNFLNCQAAGAQAQYRSGTGGWSYYKVYAVTEILPAETYNIETIRGVLFANSNNVLSTDEPALSVEKTDATAQWVKIPVRDEEDAYYLYNVGIQKFAGNKSGVKIEMSNTPVKKFYIWAHNQSGNKTDGSNTYNQADYPWTIGELKGQSEGKYWTINLCHWDGNGTGLRLCDTSGFDGGNEFAISVAGEIPAADYDALYELCNPTSFHYTVSIIGAPVGETPQITVGENHYGNGDEFDSTVLTSNDIEASEHDGYASTIVVAGSTITVTYLPAAPSLGDKEVGTVGEKVNSVETGKWYILTQVRGGETPAYATNDNKLYRATLANTLANVATKGRPASEIAQYLVRFVDSDVAGAKYIQFANGKFWGSGQQSGNVKLDAATDHADKYIVYQIGATHVGFSQTTDGTSYGRKVDNDGAGYTVGYWNSGQVTDENSNAAWYVYPVELVAPSTKANVTYHYVLGTTTKDVIVEQTVGETAAAPAAIPFATLDYGELPTVAAEGNTINVTVTETLPFVKTTDPTDPKYGVIRIHSNENRYAYVSEDGKAKCKTTYLTGEDEGYLFYIMGNVLDGFQLMSQYGAIEPTANQASLGISGAKWELRAGKAGSKLSQNVFTLYDETVKYFNSRPEGNILYWTAGDEGSTMQLIQNVEVTLSEVGFGTFYYQYPVAVPSGVKAYTLAEDGSYLTATQVTTIPVGVGVILEGAGEHNFPVAQAAATTSCLDGTYAEKDAPEGAYVLSVVDTHVGFYKFGGDKVAANKAYYVPSTPSSETQGFVVNFGGMTTGINAIQQAKGQKASFDLQGRRINKATRGLFIQNGQKVIR